MKKNFFEHQKSRKTDSSLVKFFVEHRNDLGLMIRMVQRLRAKGRPSEIKYSFGMQCHSN